MHEAANGEVGHQQAIEFLPHQIRSLAAKDDMCAPQVSFEFIERGFYFPPVVIDRRQFLRRRSFVVKDSGDQTIQRFCPFDSLEQVVRKLEAGKR